MGEAGIDKFANEGSVVRVQNAMLREQDMEQTPTQRWLLGCALSNSWDVYQCLLLSEVESYRSMRDAFELAPLDELLDCNGSALELLKDARNKLLHPTKEISYEEALAGYFREIEHRYPMGLLFAKHLQTLLDQYLRELKDSLVNSFIDDVARLPDNQLQAFLDREEGGLARALDRTDNATDRTAIEKLLRKHHELAIGLQIDPAKRDAPLRNGQGKQIRQLHDFRKLLPEALMPTTDYHSPSAVQAPIHETLSSYIPFPSTSDARGFYRGAHLPSPFDRSPKDYATLVFRAALLLSESLHYADAMLQRAFPGKSRSEILALGDWTARVPVPATAEDIATAQVGASPGVVALALLAEPLRTYRSVTAKNPALRVPELRGIATNEKAAQLAAIRNSAFHVPDGRAKVLDRAERRFLTTAPDDFHMKSISGLWRFFLSGDGIPATK